MDPRPTVQMNIGGAVETDLSCPCSDVEREQGRDKSVSTKRSIKIGVLSCVDLVVSLDVPYGCVLSHL